MYVCSHNKKKPFEKVWRSGSCTFNVPISAIKAFRNDDFEALHEFRSGLLQTGYDDRFAKYVRANQMDDETWEPLKKILAKKTYKGPDKFCLAGIHKMNYVFSTRK